MRGFLVCSLTVGLLAGAAPGALADDLKDCRYGVPDIRVASCTRRIDLPDLKPELKSAAYNNRGWGYNEKGDFEKAMPDFNEALRLNPKNAAAYGNRGYAHLRQSDFGLARSDLDKSIELKPDNAWAFTIRGRVHAALGKYERALADHTESIRLEPNSLNAYGNRANTHYAKRDYTNALTDYRKVLTLTADNPRDRAHQETAKEEQQQRDLHDDSYGASANLDFSLAKEI